MKIKIGFYPILDMLLALRQLYSVERFKPYNTVLTNIDERLTEEEREFILCVGEESRGWLHVIEKAIPMTLDGIISPEEFILYISKNPRAFFDSQVSQYEMNKASKLIRSLWQNYFSGEAAKNNKSIFERVMEISEYINNQGISSYILGITDRVVKVDEDNLKVLIKPEHIINFKEVNNVIIMPSIFASRKFTFWNNDNDYVFYISNEVNENSDLEPSEMLLLKTLALNDKTRLKMLRLLMKGSYSTADMAERFNMNPSTISRHCKVFKDSGFVDIFSQEGNSVYYSINEEEIKRSLETIINYIKGEA